MEEEDISDLSNERSDGELIASNCCCAEIYDDTDICSACKEHCEEIGEEDD